MDLMDDEGLKKSVIDQMMGELDDVTAESLRKPKGEGHGAAVVITISPKSGEMDADGDSDGDEACMDMDCDDPMHDHAMRDAKKAEEPESSDYINQLLKKLG